MSNIAVLGISHKTAPIEVREPLAFREDEIPAALKRLHRTEKVREAAILSTCNRVEIYASLSDMSQGCQDITDFLAGEAGIDGASLDGVLYFYTGADAVRHLIEVSSGIDSLVIGEAQVFGQVKRAYELARAAGSTSRAFNILFQKAFAIAKKVRSQTHIGRGSVSISSIAVELAEKLLGGLSERRVMVIGAGKMGELTIKSLVSKGVRSLIFCNRTYDKALELAQRFGGEAVRFTESEEALKDADMLITSSAAPHYIIDAELIHHIVSERERPILLIDISVPRNIHPEAGRVKGAHLYNVDGLEAAAKRNLEMRKARVSDCLSVIKREAPRIMDALSADFEYAVRR